MVKPVYPVNVGKLNLINRLIVPVTYLDGQDIEIRVGDDDSDLGEHTIALFICMVYVMNKNRIQLVFMVRYL